jgi:hypothetical protein
MGKIDFKKELKHLYNSSAKEVSFVDVPDMNFLMIDGKGDPNNSAKYASAVEALFGLSYTIKFMIKKGPLGIDYGVMPLEGLWWVDDMSEFSTDNKSGWKWTMMIMQPEFVTKKIVDAALVEFSKKKDLLAISSVRFEALIEGKCAQIMHIGPFSEEGSTVKRLHEFISSAGSVLAGKHHEIYLSDIRKADPSRWKTIIRQPVE